VLAAHRRGLSEEQNGKKHGLNVAAVRAVVCKRLNVKRAAVAWSSALDHALTARARMLWKQRPDLRAGPSLSGLGWRMLSVIFEAAEHFAVSENALRKRAHRIGLDCRPWWRRWFTPS